MTSWSDNWLYILEKTALFNGFSEEELTKFLDTTEARTIDLRENYQLDISPDHWYYLIRGDVKLDEATYEAPFLLLGKYYIGEHYAVSNCKVLALKEEQIAKYYLRPNEEKDNQAINSGSLRNQFNERALNILAKQYSEKLKNERAFYQTDTVSRLKSYLRKFPIGEWTTISESQNYLSKELDMSRVQLHRCWGQLQDEGYLTRKGKKLLIHRELKIDEE